VCSVTSQPNTAGWLNRAILNRQGYWPTGRAPVKHLSAMMPVESGAS
jgi:hypothetical protein